MKYENSYQALTFETMLKTIVKKTIKKNYNNYSDEIKDEIDLDNIFGSLFPKFDLNSEDFQKELGKVINPISKNGEFVKIIEPASYFSLFIEYMVHNTFSETQDSSSVSFKKHYEDMILSTLKDRNDGGEWFIKSSDRVKYSFSIDELSRKFLDLNSEAFLRVKLSNVKKDDVERRVKKKL